MSLAPRIISLCVAVVCLLATAVAGPGLTPALRASDVDVAGCGVYAAGQRLADPPLPSVLAALGLGKATAPAWSTGPRAEERRDFVVAFKAPVAVGTVICGWASTTHDVAILRAGMSLPVDPRDDAAWQVLEARPVRTLPPGTTVRAIRLSHRYSDMPWNLRSVESVMPTLLLLRERAYSPLDFGAAGRGRQTWQRQGGAAQTDRLVSYWPDSREVQTIVLVAPANSTLEALATATTEHPLATDAVWDAVDIHTTATGPQLLALPTPLATRALRLSCPVVAGWNRAAWLQPLVALGDEPVPAGYLPSPPVAVDLQMPMDGFAAVRLRDAAGREIRRLAAELYLPQGPAPIAWDLRDDAGTYVQPGTYSWRAVARPPLKLTYQATVYNAGNPPWRAEVRGRGGWMADHSPPVAVAAVGDRVFMSSLGAEFGDAMIATDPDGRKIWTQHEGAQRLLADDRFVYQIDHSEIIRYDPATFRGTRILSLHYSQDVPPPRSDYFVARSMSAAIAKDRLYLSVSGDEAPWIKSAVKPGDFDLSACFPPPDPSKVHETDYTGAERFLGAFLAITSSTRAYFGDAVDRGPLAHALVLRLRHEVPVGSIMLPAGIQVYALREGKALPAIFNPRTDVGGPDPMAALTDGGGDDLGLGLADMDTRFAVDTWLRLDTPEPGMGLARAEAGMRTRAIVFTAPNLQRLDYALILDRRYRNATADARLIPLEGSLDGKGGWSQQRPAGSPISAGNPATCAIVWDQPRAIRGFAVCDPFPWSLWAVDMWIGDADATIDAAAIADDTNWRHVFSHAQQRNHVKMNWHTDRVVTGDLGAVRHVRALRMRILEPSRATDSNNTRAAGGFSSFVAFEPLGGDVALPDSYARRITEIQLTDGPATLLRHIQVPSAGAIAAAPDGRLYLVSGGAIVRLDDLDATPVAMTEVIDASKLASPIAMTFDRTGKLYVLELGSRCVDVFDVTSGERVGRIGTPGGVHPGPYDPTTFSTPVAMTIDPQDKLWIVEQDFQPKRITRWSLDGVLEKQLYGPTHYGGGGMIDPRDHGVVYYHGMKFRIDWQTHDWQLEAIVQRPGESPMNTRIPGRVIYYQGHRYLASDVPWSSFGDTGAVTAICVERESIAVPVAAAGVLGRWSAYSRSRALQAAWKSHDPNTTAFVWSDLDGDGDVQEGEVQLRDNLDFGSITFIGEDLSFNFHGSRLPLKTLRDDGLPLFDITETVPAAGERWTGPDGETFVMGHSLRDPSGKQMWTYPDDYMSVQGSARAPGGISWRAPGMLVGGLRPVGRFTVGDEVYYTVLGNYGDWFTFTRDGMLAACIFGGPAGYGRRYFCTPDYRPGETDLSDLRTTVEDFYGNIVTAEDGHVYAVAGKNHLSMIRVEGLEQLQRQSGTLTITAEDIERVKEWTQKRQQILQAMEEPRVLQVAGRLKPPQIDGDVAVDWVDQSQALVRETYDLRGEVNGRWTFALAWDATNLYVCAQAHDDSPMLNRGEDWRTLHQYGDAVDLAISLDPAAPADRLEPTAGDRRILLSVDSAGKPRVLLMRYHSPGAAAELGHTYTSPVASTHVDELRLLPDARVALRRNATDWTLEAAIPWSALGAAAPKAGDHLRGDLGFLASDEAGMSTVERFYWANRRHVVMGDLPAESRIDPGFWGEFIVGPIPNPMDTIDLDTLGSGSASDSLLDR